MGRVIDKQQNLVLARGILVFLSHWRIDSSSSKGVGLACFQAFPYEAFPHDAFPYDAFSYDAFSYAFFVCLVADFVPDPVHNLFTWCMGAATCCHG